MANKRPKPEEIVSKLRQVEVLMGQGLSRLDAIRWIGVVEQTYYRWRIRSDNGPEFIAQAVRDWISAVGAKRLTSSPDLPGRMVSRVLSNQWRSHAQCESFNARFRHEMLNGEVFCSLREAQILIEQGRKHYNTKRPHSALGYSSNPTQIKERASLCTH